MKKVMKCDDCGELFYHDQCIKLFFRGAFLLLCEWCFYDYIMKTADIPPEKRVWFKYIGTEIH